MSAPKDFDLVAKSIGRVIAEIRRDQGLTQAELAKSMKVETQRLSTIERGQTNLTLRTMLTVVHALDVPLMELFRAPTGPSRKPKRGRPKKDS